MRDLFGLDTRKLLKDAKVPVRCINSAGGYQSFTPTAALTNKKYADFGAVTIDGVGHYPMLEKPDEFNRELRDVLEELRPGSEPASPGTGASGNEIAGRLPGSPVSFRVRIGGRGRRAVCPGLLLQQPLQPLEFLA